MSDAVNDNVPSLRLLVVGAGALGNALLPRVVRWKWEGITVMDGDRVEGKNLERQELFAPVDIGKPKSEVVAAWVRNMPIAVRLIARDEFIDAKNAKAIIAMHDVVADCTDDAHVKRLLDRTCADYGVALVSGSVHGKEGQVILLHAEGEGEVITREDLFQGKPGMEQDGCDMRQVPLETLEETGRRMAQLLRALMVRQNVQLETRLQLAERQVHASRAQVQQVLINLLLNAIEALAAVSDRPRRIVLESASAGPGLVELRVRDNGPGIAPADRERIFDALYSTKPHGTGVGLSISRAIVRAHGGRIECVPAEPHGALFRVVLPVRSEATAAPPSARHDHA